MAPPSSATVSPTMKPALGWPASSQTAGCALSRSSAG